MLSWFYNCFSSLVIDKEIIRCIVSCFAHDIRYSKEIRTVEDKKAMQECPKKVNEWEEKNVMKFNEGKFEQMTSEKIKDIEVEVYNTPSGKEKEIKYHVKDLGVMKSADQRFRKHINEIITPCKIKLGNILRNFAIRKREPMMNWFKSQREVKRNIVWSPTHKKDISRL